jgi:hypothetical protein
MRLSHAHTHPYNNAESATTIHPAPSNQVMSVPTLPAAPFSGFPVVAELPAADEAPSVTVTVPALPVAADETLPVTVTVLGPPVTTPVDVDAVIANVVEGPDTEIYKKNEKSGIEREVSGFGKYPQGCDRYSCTKAEIVEICISCQWRQSNEAQRRQRRNRTYS